ncbi:MAG: ATP-binding cassette domain-containing protein, partial [Microbacteriaceae bacterium]|nr:ATP-binding cassette domain-containing protein [Microbacteriaceae bacterium]
VQGDAAEASDTERLEDLLPLPAAPTQLELRDVRFRYPGAESDVLDGISLSIPMGSSLAIVGPSGAGKSTLIDILLGLSLPTGGELFIDDAPLEQVLGQWRTRVGYVPQRVALFDGSIAQNVALTWEENYDLDQVQRALERAHLGALAERPGGLLARIGERGDSVSGGQQPRLGIARALYTDPLVMVMDEATSSLDTATENRVTQSMRELQGEVTFITVAHRLATIREYDQVCYLDAGRIRGVGTFDEVVAQVPDFALQAKLAGLTT